MRMIYIVTNNKGIIRQITYHCNHYIKMHKKNIKNNIIIKIFDFEIIN
jgi:hypothetical protein